MTKVICIDCETTGLDRASDYVIDVVIRDFDDPNIVKMWRVHPPKPIPPEISAIHGITNEMVRESPTFGMVSEEIKVAIEAADVIVGYNPDFDIDLLKMEFIRAGWSAVKWPKVVVCAMRLWDICIPREKRHLQNAYKEFVNPAGFDGHHGALADTLATVHVLRNQMKMFDLVGKPWVELNPERATWVGSSNHFIWSDDSREAIMVNFGKMKGYTLMMCDRGLMHWIMKNDFPPHVKQLIEKALVFTSLPILEASVAIAAWARVNL